MTRIVLTATAVATALTLAGCGSKTNNEQAPAGTIAENTAAIETPALEPALAPGQTFANTAAASDAFEIATSNLALEKSQSRAVKRFAEDMVKAHTESTTKLQAAAASASPALTPNPMLSPAQQDKLTALRDKSGADFDQAYIAEQIDAHQMALDGLQTYAAGPDVEPLSAFAKEMVPIVTAHLNLAKSLKP